jgi:hypothetical protein
MIAKRAFQVDADRSNTTLTDCIRAQIRLYHSGVCLRVPMDSLSSLGHPAWFNSSKPDPLRHVQPYQSLV